MVPYTLTYRLKGSIVAELIRFTTREKAERYATRHADWFDFVALTDPQGEPITIRHVTPTRSR